MNLKLNELSWILQENLIDKTANNEYFRSLESQPIFREKIFVDFTAKIPFLVCLTKILSVIFEQKHPIFYENWPKHDFQAKIIYFSTKTPLFRIAKLNSSSIFEQFLARDISESNQLLNLTDCLLNFEYNGPALLASQF